MSHNNKLVHSQSKLRRPPLISLLSILGLLPIISRYFPSLLTINMNTSHGKVYIHVPTLCCESYVCGARDCVCVCVCVCVCRYILVSCLFSSDNTCNTIPFFAKIRAVTSLGPGEYSSPLIYTIQGMGTLSIILGYTSLAL